MVFNSHVKLTETMFQLGIRPSNTPDRHQLPLPTLLNRRHIGQMRQILIKKSPMVFTCKQTKDGIGLSLVSVIRDVLHCSTLRLKVNMTAG